MSCMCANTLAVHSIAFAHTHTHTHPICLIDLEVVEKFLITICYSTLQHNDVMMLMWQAGRQAAIITSSINFEPTLNLHLKMQLKF